MIIYNLFIGCSLCLVACLGPGGLHIAAILKAFRSQLGLRRTENMIGLVCVEGVLFASSQAT